MKVIVPIIKIVGDFCNLRCRYCFYNTRDQLVRHVMSDELLENSLYIIWGFLVGDLFLSGMAENHYLPGYRFFKRS